MSHRYSGTLVHFHSSRQEVHVMNEAGREFLSS